MEDDLLLAHCMGLLKVIQHFGKGCHDSSNLRGVCERETGGGGFFGEKEDETVCVCVSCRRVKERKVDLCNVYIAHHSKSLESSESEHPS
jgi:hypothetical protein